MDEADVVIGVLSDAHGNSAAMARGVELLLQHGTEEFVFLGDCVGYVSGPQVVTYLRDFPYPLRCLRGNHDHMLLTGDWPANRCTD